MKKLFLTLAFLSATLCQASNKIYIDHEDLDVSKECFHIHTGKNEWLSTKTMHRDASGMFAMQEEIIHVDDLSGEYEQTWKCPYCHNYYKIGNACNNANCPSKYR